MILQPKRRPCLLEENWRRALKRHQELRAARWSKKFWLSSQPLPPRRAESLGFLRDISQHSHSLAALQSPHLLQLFEFPPWKLYSITAFPCPKRFLQEAFQFHLFYQRSLQEPFQFHYRIHLPTLNLNSFPTSLNLLLYTCHVPVLPNLPSILLPRTQSLVGFKFHQNFHLPEFVLSCLMKVLPGVVSGRLSPRGSPIVTIPVTIHYR